MFLTIVVFILIIGFLVLIHELGHFIVAKKTGMKVEEFGLGFPPTIYKKRINETKYCINLIPLGGYVKIKGEDSQYAQDEDSFSAKPIYKRALTVIAGVVMNIIAGWLIFVILFAISAPVEINETIDEKYLLNEKIIISEIIVDSPAQEQGLKPGDEIIAIQGKRVETIIEFQNIIASAESEVVIDFMRSKKNKTINVNPKIIQDISEDRKVIGVALSKMGNVRYPIHKAFIAGTEAAYGYLERIVKAFCGIIKGAFSGQGLQGVGGPVAIAVITNDMIDLGFSRVLIFTAILSFNLAILNILPFPALDGGRLIFMAVEAVRGKPSKKEVEAWFHRIGFILFMLLAIFITYRDILRFGGRIWQRVIG
ncbi:site-2 protease family protein [Patescibacteria group bacterium]|nr:site-2 protease family protein [Patescibacteria group bacterium]